MSTTTTTTSNFRLNAIRLFLTYPQCPLLPSAVINRFKDFFPDKIEYGIVSQELHEDGSPHLHAVIVLKKKCDIRREHYLDLVHDGSTYHGNYQAVKNIEQCVAYVMKDTERPTLGINCDPNSILSLLKRNKNPKSHLIAEMIHQGATLEDISLVYPGFVMMNLQKIQNYQRWILNRQLLATPKKPFSSCAPFDRQAPNRVWEAEIARWVNLNFQIPRKHRQRQLWIHGQTSTGKTHLLLQLNEYFHGYHVPDDGKWMDGYSDSYDFAYFDEFKGSKTIQFLNGFVEGSHYPLPQRGQQPYVKKKNLPVIICSNYGIQGVYQKADPIVVAALQTRFEEIEVPAACRIELQFEFDSSDDDIYWGNDHDGEAPEMEFEDAGSSDEEEPYEGPCPVSGAPVIVPNLVCPELYD